MLLDFGKVGLSYNGKEQPSDPEANITAVLVYDELPQKPVLVLLDHMQGSGKWVTMKFKIDHDIATAFRCIKVPTLIMYNSQREETARVHGDQNIQDLLQKVME